MEDITNYHLFSQSAMIFEHLCVWCKRYYYKTGPIFKDLIIIMVRQFRQKNKIIPFCIWHLAECQPLYFGVAFQKMALIIDDNIYQPVHIYICLLVDISTHLPLSVHIGVEILDNRPSSCLALVDTTK